MAKSEEEDVVGTYFKPIRASRLVAQAQETKRGKIFFLLIFLVTSLKLFGWIQFGRVQIFQALMDIFGNLLRQNTNFPRVNKTLDLKIFVQKLFDVWLFAKLQSQYAFEICCELATIFVNYTVFIKHKNTVVDTL